MVKVLFLARFWRQTMERRIGSIDGVALTATDDFDAFLAGIPQADVLIVPDLHGAQAKRLVDAVAAAPNVRWIHSVSAGNEGLIAAGLPATRLLTRTLGAAANTIGEHVFALFLALGHRVPDHLAAMTEARWQRPKTAPLALEGRTLLVVGLGHIGREIARLGRAFRMTVIAANRTVAPDDAVDEIHPLSALPDLLPRADLIAVAVAMSPATRHLFDAAAFARCKPTALLVNIARGGIVDSKALCDALVAGRLGGAGLDVTEPEPLPPDHPLWRAPNLIISPHMSALGSPESERRQADRVGENIERYVRGEDPIGVLAPGA
ncbi:MAG TPA: D-2-hydroxyacid dehydrogenase [Hyphomicrobiales bacterium]|nr:D-2-hydroxyacid dehydrogenase [Hyphomicrobiales bacterium]